MHHNRAFEREIGRIFVGTLDIEPSVRESMESTTLRRTGQLRTSPVEAILAEADLPSMETRAAQLCTVAKEKSLSTTLINPGHITATQLVR